jgi:hypothetical protein
MQEITLIVVSLLMRDITADAVMWPFRTLA